MNVFGRAPRTRALSWTLCVLGLALLSGRPAEAQPVDLRPRYTKEQKREVHTRSSLVCKLELRLPSRDLVRTSEMEQTSARRFRDEVLELRTRERAGKVARRYTSAWDGEREPGEHKLRRVLSPLSGRRLEISWDAKAKKRRAHALPKSAKQPPKDVLLREALGERWDVVLPPKPVAIGDTWELDGKALRAAIGPRLAREGKLVCKLERLKTEALDELTAEQRYAHVSLALESEASPPSAEAEVKVTTRLTGLLRFSLRHKQIASVTLRGTATLNSVRSEDGHELTIRGEGPFELTRRVYFPRKPRKGDRPKKGRDEGLPDGPKTPGEKTPGEKPGEKRGPR